MTHELTTHHRTSENGAKIAGAWQACQRFIQIRTAGKQETDKSHRIEPRGLHIQLHHMAINLARQLPPIPQYEPAHPGQPTVKFMPQGHRLLLIWLESAGAPRRRQTPPGSRRPVLKVRSFENENRHFLWVRVRVFSYYSCKKLPCFGKPEPEERRGNLFAHKGADI